MSKYFLGISVMLFIGAFVLELLGHDEAAITPAVFGFLIVCGTGIATVASYD